MSKIQPLNEAQEEKYQKFVSAVREAQDAFFSEMRELDSDYKQITSAATNFYLSAAAWSAMHLAEYGFNRRPKWRLWLWAAFRHMRKAKRAFVKEKWPQVWRYIVKIEDGKTTAKCVDMKPEPSST